MKFIMKKATSLLLVLSLSLLCFPIGAIDFSFEEKGGGLQVDPESSDEPPLEEEEFIPWDVELKAGDLTLYELSTAVLDEGDIPDIISLELIEKNHHVNRLYEQEPDAYTIMFQNRDGSKTIYSFSIPVKNKVDNAYSDMSFEEIKTLSAFGGSEVMSADLETQRNVEFSGGSIDCHIKNINGQDPIMPHNIGKFVIFSDDLNTLEGGIKSYSYDATEEARSYAEGGEGLENFTVSVESAISSESRSGGSTKFNAVSFTYSEVAGEFAIRSILSEKFLSCVDSTLTMSDTILTPSSKWYIKYEGYDDYKVIPMSRQDLALGYDNDSEELALLSLNVENDMEYKQISWMIDENDEGCIVFVNNLYYHALDDTPGADSTGHIYWQIGNNNPNTVFLKSIDPDSVITATVDLEKINYQYIELKQEPENASYSDTYGNFEWYYYDSNGEKYELFFDMDYGICIDDLIGATRIYCQYKYNPKIKVTVLLIVSEPFEINSGATYLIRPYTKEITKDTKLLTMNVGDDNNSLSLSGWSNIWNKRSQAFSITAMESDRYCITSILAKNQYEGYDFSIYSSNKNYYSTDKTKKKNTISLDNEINIQLVTQENISNNEMWYLYLKGDSFYMLNVKGDKEYYFSHSNETIDISNSESSQGWCITALGTDTPCIKQTTDYYCCVASTLQVLCSINLPEYTGTINYEEKMDALNSENTMTTIDGGSTSRAVQKALDAEAGEGNYTSILKNNLDIGVDNNKKLASILKLSLSNGSPLIANVMGMKLEYCENDTDYKQHFICVIGYDEATNSVLVSDCTYVMQDVSDQTGNLIYPFGIHVISLDNLANALLSKIFYRVTKIN